MAEVQLPTSGQASLTVAYLRAQRDSFGTAFPCDGDSGARRAFECVARQIAQVQR